MGQAPHGAGARRAPAAPDRRDLHYRRLEGDGRHGGGEETPTALFSESAGFLRFFSQIWSLNLAMASRPGQ